MKHTAKNRNLLKIGAVLMLAFAWAIIPFAMNDSIVEANVASDIRINASLSGAAINGVTPSGFAEHRFDPGDSDMRRRLKVEAFTVNLPAGTVLDVRVNNAVVMQFVVSGFGYASNEIDTNNGQSVPSVSNGTPITVTQGTTTILSGTFGIVVPSPSPSASPSGSPTGSPTGSPNPSPSASPTGSPTGSPNPSPSASPTGSPNPSPSASPTGSPNPSPTGSPNPSPSPNGGDLFAVLSGATVNGVLPNGLGQYEIHSSRRELEVEINQVNLPSGTALSVTVDNTPVGQLFLDGSGHGKLRLRTDNGQFVPFVANGSTIILSNGGNTILSGIFGGGVSPSPSPSPSGSPSPSPTGSPNPSPSVSPSPSPTGSPNPSPSVSPSPTGSPSPSPSASPSPSPSASPTPGLGRNFEAQLTGSQMIPPITTTATGEIKVLLNQAETEATITGQFQNLSSAQTSAKIFLTAGDTSVIFELSVIGGTSGTLTGITVPVNALQVAQLRTGMWFAVIGSVNNPLGEIGGKFKTQSLSSDFDGDGRDDFAVYRPTNGVWYAQNSQGFSAQVLGSGRDKLVSGDFDGDGKTDAAVFRNENNLGVWSIKRSSDGGITTMPFGFASDNAIRGDFDGDGRSDLALYRSSNGTWYIQKSSNSEFYGVRFGASEDIPVAADFDGDGKSDIAVFRPSNGVWYWLKSSNGAVDARAFGQSGDVPVTGDFDGDGKSDVTVFRPTTGVWYIQRSSNGSYDYRQFGLGSDIPVAGNFDGDNKTDIAVFRPSNGVWYIWRSLDGTFDFRQFGQNGDVPTHSR